MSAKLGFLKTEIIEAVSAAALQTAVNAFFKGNAGTAIKEEKLVQIDWFVLDGTHYQAFIVYTE